MKLELIDHSVFKDSFDSVSRIVDDVTCTIDENGFHMNAIDRSHVCFVSLELAYEMFDSFDCTVTEKICLDTNEFMKILKRMKNNDVLGLIVDENNLTINLKGDVDRTFKIRLIDMDYEVPQPPSLALPVSVEVESSLIKDALTDMELFSTNLTFTIDKDYLTINTDGEFGDAEFKYLHGEQGITGEYSSSFSIQKLKNIFTASKFSEYVKLNLGKDMPIEIEFKKVTDDGVLKYLLAPQINQEEDY